MQSPAYGLKFCYARAGVARVILAFAASHVRFHGYFESTSTKQYSRSFSGAKDSSLSRFLFIIITPCSKYSKKQCLNGYFKV